MFAILCKDLCQRVSDKLSSRDGRVTVGFLFHIAHARDAHSNTETRRRWSTIASDVFYARNP